VEKGAFRPICADDDQSVFISGDPHPPKSGDEPDGTPFQSLKGQAYCSQQVVPVSVCRLMKLND
jgi:hypothetical protein